MSLTEFIKEPNVKDKLTKLFPCPSFRADGEPLVPPQSKRYGLIGTAFDYLLRFYARALNIRTEPPIDTWVAEDAVMRQLNPLIDDHWRYLQVARETIVRARDRWRSYVKSRRVTRNLIESCLLLARIDPLFRAGYLDPFPGKVHPEDIEEMRALIGLVKPDWFRAKKHCLLNPKFGRGTSLVGGADADLIIDGMLIDIKTTKNPQLTRGHYHQLIGYMLLHRIGGA